MDEVHTIPSSRNHLRSDKQQGQGRNPTASTENQGTDQALRQELESVRKVNEAIEGVIESLEKARNNMGTVINTVSSASLLLNTWTKILSQTEHNQRLILNPSWHGASQEQEDMESAALAKQQAAERSQLEEQEKKAALARRLEEEERRKDEAVSKTVKPTASRGRGRGLSRGGSQSSSANTSYTATGGQHGVRGNTRSAVPSRGQTSSIGRGDSARDRGRGT